MKSIPPFHLIYSLQFYSSLVMEPRDKKKLSLTQLYCKTKFVEVLFMYKKQKNVLSLHPHQFDTIVFDFVEMILHVLVLQSDERVYVR